MKKNKEDKQSFEKIEQVFILDESTKFLGEGYSNATIITSQGDLESIISLKNDLKKVIVFCELKWKDKLYQQFYGFEVARELRMRYKLLCPIILVSVLPQKYFEAKAQKEIKYNILYGRGTGFVEWVNINNFDSISKSILPLSEAALSDLNEMLLKLRGFVIDKITHDLQLTLTEEELKARMNFIGSYLDNRQKAKIGWEDFLKRFIELQNNDDDFRKPKEEFLIKCKQELGDETIAKSINDLAIRHKVLVVEDDPEFIKNIEVNLKDHFELIVTDNSDEAIHTLNEDGNNSIVGVITDWRLYSDYSKTYWQKLQGYEILEYSAKTHFAALFSLTSEDDRNVHDIRNKLGLDIHLFKKQHLTSKGQWDLIADVVKQRCDRIVDILASQPTGASWQKLKPAYIQKRMTNWNEFEDRISVKAISLYKYYYGAILNEDHRGVQSITDKGLILKSNLENILTIRRIFIGLYFTLIKEGNYLQEIDKVFLSPKSQPVQSDTRNLDSELKHHAVDVYSILKKEWYDDNFAGVSSEKKGNEMKKYSQNFRNFVNTSLCIELTELPNNGILIEEKDWFRKNDIDFSFNYNFLSNEEAD